MDVLYETPAIYDMPRDYTGALVWSDGRFWFASLYEHGHWLGRLSRDFELRSVGPESALSALCGQDSREAVEEALALYVLKESARE